MKVTALVLVAGLLILAGCGGGSDGDGAGASAGAAMMEPGSSGSGDGPARSGDEAREAGASSATGTTITAGDSEFGRMLFGSDDQAIYIFENDTRDETVCYGECADAWPPVYTEGEPRAGKGVDQALLGTVKRDDGRLQVTYDGQPLYFYAHEDPDEVRCHNVNLNGGFWWAVGPDGERLP